MSSLASATLEDDLDLVLVKYKHANEIEGRVTLRANYSVFHSVNVTVILALYW